MCLSCCSWLVTAAHCMDGASSGYTVVLGAFDIHTLEQGLPRRYSLDRIIVHPQFVYSSQEQFPNDIALLRLTTNADTSNKYVSTIAMANKNEDFAGNYNCYITGWGAMYNGGSTPNKLQVGWGILNICRITHRCRKSFERTQLYSEVPPGDCW